MATLTVGQHVGGMAGVATVLGLLLALSLLEQGSEVAAADGDDHDTDWTAGLRKLHRASTALHFV